MTKVKNIPIHTADMPVVSFLCAWSMQYIQTLYEQCNMFGFILIVTEITNKVSTNTSS